MIFYRLDKIKLNFTEKDAPAYPEQAQQFSKQIYRAFLSEITRLADSDIHFYRDNVKSFQKAVNCEIKSNSVCQLRQAARMIRSCKFSRFGFTMD